MKRKFSKILGVGLTLALLASLLLTAAPVSAVTTPAVTLADGPAINPAYEISKLNVYTVLFTTGAKVLGGEEIVVVFDAGDISAITTTDVEIESTAGLGGTAFTAHTNPASAVVDGQTLTITPHAATVIGAGAIVQLTIGVTNYVTNPDTAGTYNLTVATTQEAAVTSGDYTIKVPEIPGLPGVASIYNPTGVLMAQKIDLYEAIAAAGPDYTIQVGPGTYTLADSKELTIAHEGLTLVSTDGAADTIIDASALTGGGVGDGAINITAAGVTVDGFTVLDASIGSGINIDAIDAIVQNNTVTFESFGTGIDVASFATGVTVSGNTLNENAAIIVHGSDCTVSGNTFGHIMNFWAEGTLSGVTITDNNFVANEDANFGILLRGAGTIDDTLIEGNILNDRANGGILIGAPAVTVTNLTITGNDITNNGDGTGTEDSGIRIYADTDWGNGNVIKFNTITGNEDYGILNEDEADIDATFNWWGPDGASVLGTDGSVTTAPVLADVAEAVFSASDAVANAISLDAKTTVGVAVSGATAATAIVVAEYIANPQADIAGAIAFYDVYAAGVTSPTTTKVTIKFYTGDALTAVYLWSAGTDMWLQVDEGGFSSYGGYVWVEVTADVLGGTPFALVAGAAAALDAPQIISPDVGEKDVDLRPSFAWTAVAGVLGYEFELADNPNFVAPLMKLSGELGRLIVPYYQYMPQLDYSKAYYWRVRAVDATAESPWDGGVFITVAEVIAEPEPEPEWKCDEGLTFDSRAALEAHLATAEAHQPVEEPDIILEPPDIEVVVPLPAETPITPSWIYVIIAVGGVLVIALIVLIVRTRRVA